MRPGRLQGKALRRLYEEVRDRENECCALCGVYVPHGNIPHHEPPRSRSGTDSLEGLLLLCYDCHQQRHFDGRKSNAVKEKCVSYIERLYGSEK